MNAYDEGYRAAKHGLIISENPFRSFDSEYKEWRSGWHFFHEENKTTGARFRALKNPKRRTRKKTVRRVSTGKRRVSGVTIRKVTRFTKKARTPKLKRQFKHVYKSARKRGAKIGSAIAQASGVIKRSLSPRKRGKIVRVRKNPARHRAMLTANGTHYYRHSTGSFVERKGDATVYKSTSAAASAMRSLANKLPSSVRFVKVIPA